MGRSIFFDASDDTYVGRVGGFRGVQCKADGKTADNSISGPDGVVIIGGEVWAGDGDSTLKVINIKTFDVTATIKVTDPTDNTKTMRVDVMAYDARDHILAAANNANVPPFVTLVNTDTHQILGQIVFDFRMGRRMPKILASSSRSGRHRPPVLRLRPEYRPE